LKLSSSAAAERELLAPREDVWAFLAEPRHLADWWPGIAAVEPDARGLRRGARWRLRRGGQPGLLRKAHSASTLLVRDVDPPRRLAWHLVAERLDVELELDVEETGRTRARLSVSGPFVLGWRRSLPKVALERLHSLVQTAVTL
jgi:uncharacterized protein YndB with AHSA1/START domain